MGFCDGVSMKANLWSDRFAPCVLKKKGSRCFSASPLLVFIPLNTNIRGMERKVEGGGGE